MSSSVWTADANEALSLSLGAHLLPTLSSPLRSPPCLPVRAPEDKASLWSREVYEGFHPTFTYPVSPSPFSFSQRHQPPFSRYLARRRRSTVTRTSASRYAVTHAPRSPPLTCPQLKFASGSLVQYLNVHHSERLPPSSAVDEIEDTISKFIAPGYYTDEQKFLERVEQDAVNFKPFGEKIYSYSRAAMPLNKGKNVAISQVLSPEDQETVDYEVYHVSQHFHSPLSNGAPCFGGWHTFCRLESSPGVVGPRSCARRRSDVSPCCGVGCRVQARTFETSHSLCMPCVSLTTHSVAERSRCN